MEKIIDLSKVEEIFYDDKEEIAVLLKLFVATFPEFMEAVERCVHHDDIQGFKFAIHKFKSSCQFVAATSFVDRLRTLESIEMKDFNRHIPEIESIKAVSLQLKQEVEDYLGANERISE